MQERGDGNPNKGLLYTILGMGAVEQVKEETESLITQYRLDQRLDNEQLSIFKAYFSSYRVLRSKNNTEILDAQKNVQFDMLEKFRFTRPFWNLMNNTAETLREVSEALRQEGDKRSQAYTEERGNGAAITPAKLQRVANMINTQLTNIKDKGKRERTITDFLNSELPLKEE